ncbi:hypothetical protein BH09PSE1_BH09PSE1_04140 [soil metagenome]
MPHADIDRFRRLCGQFRWLAIFMVVCVGALLALMHVISPVVLATRGVLAEPTQRILAGLIMAAPAVCYLFGVWSIGRGLGQIQKGRLIQPALASTLRRVGLALGVGAILQVFVISNLMRLIAGGRGGYLYWDVGAMTLGMIGGALFLLGRVADQAGRVQAELDEII